MDAVFTMVFNKKINFFFISLNILGKNPSNITIFAQLPQNIAMGFSELFATVASFEFAYFTAPCSAQSLFMSLRFVSVGIASYIDAAYIIIFPPSS
jgi:dipeptide/tripeptide permease